MHLADPHRTRTAWQPGFTVDPMVEQVMFAHRCLLAEVKPKAYEQYCTFM